MLRVARPLQGDWCTFPFEMPLVVVRVLGDHVGSPLLKLFVVNG
jgi:hypothetical protein